MSVQCRAGRHEVLLGVLHKQVVIPLYFLELQVSIREIRGQRGEGSVEILHHLINLEDVPGVLLDVVEEGKCIIETILIVGQVIDVEIEPVNSDVYCLSNL